MSRNRTGPRKACNDGLCQLWLPCQAKSHCYWTTLVRNESMITYNSIVDCYICTVSPGSPSLAAQTDDEAQRQAGWPRELCMWQSSAVKFHGLLTQILYRSAGCRSFSDASSTTGGKMIAEEDRRDIRSWRGPW